MFGNFDTSWTAGFSPLNQLNETLQKMKTDIEHNLETSLGIPHLTTAGEVSVKSDEDPAKSNGATTSPEEQVSNSSITFFPAALQAAPLAGLLQPTAPPPPPVPSAAAPAVETPAQALGPPPDPGSENEPDLAGGGGDDGVDGWGTDALDDLALAPSEPVATEGVPDSPLPADPPLEVPATGAQSPPRNVHAEGEQHIPLEVEKAVADSSAERTASVQEIQMQDAQGVCKSDEQSTEAPQEVHEVEDQEGWSTALRNFPRDTEVPVTPSRMATGAPQGLPDEGDEGDRDCGEVGDVTSKPGDGLSVRAPPFPTHNGVVDREHVTSTMEVREGGSASAALGEGGEGHPGGRVNDEHASPRSVGEASDAGSGEHPPESIASAASHVGHLPDVQRGREDGQAMVADVDVGALGVDEARLMVEQLRSVLRGREEQLERMLEECASLQEVAKQLQEKNAELALKAHKVSEEDLEALRAEFEERLGKADSKIYVLTKERDALRRGSEKLSASTDLIKEKDAIIQQVMEEGEKLSKKQLSQENTMKKLRQEIQELILQKSSVSTNLAQERQKAEAAISARAKVEAELASLRQAHRAELDAEKAHYEGLLQKLRSEKAEAEEKARTTAKEGLARKLKDAEIRAESLGDSVEELRAGLERQRSAADLREDMLKREVADLERRCQAAEARHEELAAKLPEATRPLLRQMEAMQAAAAGQQQAWLAAERTLTNRLQDAEAAAAAATERERLASERLAAANSRASAAAAALEEVRARVGQVQTQLEEEQRIRAICEGRARTLTDQLDLASERYAAEVKQREAVEQSAGDALEAERRASVAQLAGAEERVAQLEKQLRAASQLGSPATAPNPGPPAMAGPGYKWVLVKDGEDLPDSPMSSRSSMRDMGMGSGLPPPRSGVVEVERLRDVVRNKEEQIGALQQQLTSLEATRDSLAEELLRASHAAEGAAQAQRDLAHTRREHEELLAHLTACTEMLGERDERLGELEADVADVKELYKDQIVFMVERLAMLEAAEQARSASDTS